MSVSPARFAGNRGFQTSIAAVVTAVLLAGSVRSIVLALEQLMRPEVIWLINRASDQGHFHLTHVFDPGVTWMAMILNLFSGAVGLCLTYRLANWNYKKHSQPWVELKEWSPPADPNPS